VRTAVDAVSGTLLLLGCATALVASIGLHTVPDAFARLHVQTKATTLAILLTAVGAMLRMSHWADVLKLLLVVALQFWTTPVGSHLLGRAARIAGMRPARRLAVDDEAPLEG
jgi:multicomponent Na+:H+ antiporter subunit G